MNIYKKNFLKQVIFRIDFTSIRDQNIQLNDFQKLIKKEFPILEEITGVEIKYPLIEDKMRNIIKWVFYNKTKDKTISFEHNNITIEFKEYIDFQKFQEIVELVVNSLFAVFPSIISTRLGLRYINEIRLEGQNPFDWKGLINKSLLDSLNFVKDRKELLRYVNQIELIKDEEFRLRFQYGIPNSVYPSPIIKKEFALDYDCFTFGSLEKNEILTKINQFNDIITEIFEQSIEDDLRKVMRSD